MNKCINCGADAPFTWFCPICNEIKSKSYAISKELKEDFCDVIIRRDRMLQDFKPDLLGAQGAGQ